jgi:DNA modification methylase
MFSFIEDTVLDPFAGTFSTTMAAIRARRNSVSVELDPEYFESGSGRVQTEVARLQLFDMPPVVTLSHASEKNLSS